MSLVVQILITLLGVSCTGLLGVLTYFASDLVGATKDNSGKLSMLHIQGTKHEENINTILQSQKDQADVQKAIIDQVAENKEDIAVIKAKLPT